MPWVRYLIRSSDQLSKFLMILAAVWAMGLSVLIVADIIGNNLVGHAIPGVREIVISSIVMIVYLQLGYAIRSHSMLRADSLLLVMPVILRRIALALGYALGLVLFLMILRGTISPAVYAWTTSEFWGEGALRVPVWPTRFMILVGSGLAIVNYVVAALIDVLGLDEGGQALGGVDERRS
ncbi:MAG TPA: TRAP transporter small permease [Burkholderiales bacterium]|jgi:TRAP-type C4-dicarboxylate transport system permease small subunit